MTTETSTNAADLTQHVEAVNSHLDDLSECLRKDNPVEGLGSVGAALESASHAATALQSLIMELLALPATLLEWGEGDGDGH